MQPPKHIFEIALFFSFRAEHYVIVKILHCETLLRMFPLLKKVVARHEVKFFLHVHQQ